MTPHGLPSHQYHCLLDEQPYYLAPPRGLQLPELLGPVMVNPACWFSWRQPLPPQWAARVPFAENFFPSDHVVWIEDPATLAIWPYWVGPEYFEFLSQVAPGWPVDSDLPPHIRWVLTQAGVLVEADGLGRARRNWDGQVQEYASAFQRGYVSISNLIHPFHVGALRRYYRHQMRSGSFAVGDEQVRRRFAAHNEQVSRFFHCQLSHAISQVAQVALKPSYSYFVSYLSGAELEKHVDREQCDYSITLCFDASPEPEAESPWPINLETADGTVSVYQCLGDALLYRGCSLPHSRDRLADCFTSSSLLLHYVTADFDGKLD